MVAVPIFLSSDDDDGDGEEDDEEEEDANEGNLSNRVASTTGLI